MNDIQDKPTAELLNELETQVQRFRDTGSRQDEFAKAFTLAAIKLLCRTIGPEIGALYAADYINLASVEEAGEHNPAAS